MHNRLVALAIASILLISQNAAAQAGISMERSSADASPEVRRIAECAVEKDEARHQGVRDYSMDLTMMDFEITQYFEQTSVTAADGASYSTFRLVPPTEIAKRNTDEAHRVPPEALKEYANKLEEVGAATEREITQSGMPASMIMSKGPADGEEPWASPNPRVMTTAMAKFVRAGAEADSKISDGNAEAASNIDDMSAFFNNAVLVGTEQIDGRRANHLKADDLNYSQISDGNEFIIKTVSLWLDDEECVPLKFRMEGIAEDQGQTREMFIERLNTDYRAVPNSSMYESYRQVMRMGGVLSPSEMAEMEEARVQIEQFEKELASMPASQQTMVKNMMGSKMDMMRKMIDTGAFEFETIVRAIRVNEGVAGAVGHSAGVFGMMTTTTAPTAAGSGTDSLVQMIQRDLQALGYETGNTNGDLTKETVVAISKFQAIKGMEVTGQATPQLAGILSAAVDAQN